jgi:hypothetical protein
LVDWLRKNLNDGDKYTEGPSVNWQIENGDWIIPPKYSQQSMQNFNIYAKSNGINYVVIDWYSLTVSRYRGRVDKLKKLEGYFELDPNEGIIQKKPVKDWELVYKDSRKKVEFMVFKIL